MMFNFFKNKNNIDLTGQEGKLQKILVDLINIFWDVSRVPKAKVEASSIPPNLWLKSL